MIEDAPVRRCGGVVELVDDHDIEVIRWQRIEITGMEALYRCEDVVEPCRSCTAYPLLSERRVAQCVPERGQALIEDLLAVGYEQQSRSAEPPGERGVVERRHDGLARASGGNEEVAVMTTLPREFDEFEQPFLERVRPQLDRAEDHVRAAVGAAGPLPLIVELVWVVGNEVAGLPVAVEHGAELGNDVRVAGGRCSNVPLQPRHLRRVGEIR